LASEHAWASSSSGFERDVFKGALMASAELLNVGLGLLVLVAVGSLVVVVL
jgi:hypothetical protein